MGSVGEYSVGKDGSLAFAFATTTDLPELYLKSGAADLAAYFLEFGGSGGENHR